MDGTGSNNYNWEQNEKSSIYYDICCGITVHLIFACLYGVYIGDSKYHGGGCDDSVMWWSRALYLFHSIACVVSVFINPCLFCCARKTVSERGKKCSNIVSLIIRTISAAIYMVVFIGLSIAYYHSTNDCGSLGNLNRAYIVISATLAGISIFLVCCFFCCVFLMAKQKTSFGKFENEKINDGGYL